MARARAGTLMRLALTAVAGFLALLALRLPPRPLPARGVVLVVVDTLRADHLGAYGHWRPTSPRLDARARRGVLFEQALSTSPWTLPAMASILTGQWPTRHGAGSRARATGFAQVRRLAADAPGLAEAFRRAGYATAAFVNNSFLVPGSGLERGFDVYDHRPAGNWRHRRADATVDAALSWLARAARGRFFLLVHVFDPHLAYDAPSGVRGRFSAPYAAGELRPDKPQDVRARLATLRAEQKAYLAAAYDEEILFVDAQLERLFQGLERRGAWARTLVMLTADHGEELFEHGGFEHGHSVYQEVLRVPLVVWGPGLRARREAQPISLADLAPTLLEAQQLAPARACDGVSLWPLLRDGQPPGARALVAEGTLHRPERRALVRWPLKLHTNEHDGSRRLFDLADDPGERIDLAGARPREVQRLSAELERLLRVAAGGAPGQGLPLDPEVLESLRSLGYVE